MANVLLADDHPFFRSGVSAVLEASGHRIVATAENGDETLVAVAQEKPDVILLDIRMAGRNGISALQALRARGDNTPVIILTVEITTEQLRAALRANVNGIVFKHDTEETLLQAIDAVTRGLQFIRTDLINQALDQAEQPAGQDRLSRLTPKERQVAEQVTRGLRNREIAEVLDTTEGTVKVFLHNIYKKLSISNRTELARIAISELDS